MEFLWLFFQIVITQITSQIIYLNFYRVGNTYNSRFNIVKMNKLKILEINLQATVTFMTPLIYKKPKGSPVYSEGKIEYFGNKLGYQLLKEEVILEGDNKTSINDFYFYYFDDYFFSYDSLGLAYKSLEVKANLVYNLYEHKLINHLSFGIFCDKEENGFVYLGGFPNEVTNNKEKVICKQNRNNEQWNCPLTKVKINGTKFEYNNEHILNFQTNGIGLLAPSKFMKLFNNSILNVYIQKNLCREEVRESYIECDCDIRNDFPNMIFYIHNTPYVFNNSVIFDRRGDRCILMLNENFKRPDNWQFDFSFFKTYPTLFSYENDEIIIYSDINDKFIVRNHQLKLMIFNILSIALIISIIFNIFFIKIVKK